MMSPQSQSVIHRLLDGKSVRSGSGSISIGPLDQPADSLLRTVIQSLEELKSRTGEDQAKFLRKSYQEEQLAAAARLDDDSHADEESTESESTSDSLIENVSDGSEATLAPAYRLHQIECESFRGIAPVGELVPFEIDGQSHLIYGPNGSGKTSLLGSVVWALTEQVVCDSDDPDDDAPIHKTAAKDGLGAKIRDWPVCATLPNEAIDKKTIPACSVTIQLISNNSDESIFLRRTLNAGLEFSQDGTNWQACDDLANIGISPLDLQLSLLAPTTFGRLTIDKAPESKRLLSLMLGYDDLQDLGDLASKLAGNCTRLNTNESRLLDTNWMQLTAILKNLPDKITGLQEIQALLDTLAETKKPSKDQIADVGKTISERITENESTLAELLDVTVSKKSNSSNLSERLVIAIDILEKGFEDNFNSLGQLKIDRAFPDPTRILDEETLGSYAVGLSQFIADATDRISSRWDWWQQEQASNKATLLMHAAQFYEPDAATCPVCEQSIHGLPVNDELITFKNCDSELQDSAKEFFHKLCDELDAIFPAGLRSFARPSPQERLLADWESLSRQILKDDLLPLAVKYQPSIELISENLSIDLPKLKNCLPVDAGEKFTSHAKTFTQQILDAQTAISFLQWSHGNLDALKLELNSVLFGIDDQSKRSLLDELSAGKVIAASVMPLKQVNEELRKVFKIREGIEQLDADVEILDELHSALDDLKALKKYAENEVNDTFAEIDGKTQEIYRILYPEKGHGHVPTRRIVGKGRDKKVTTYMSNGQNDVPQQFFGNAGLQRAVALSFFFALLEKHPRGLDFVIMDDPILSLDDNHREKWSREILKDQMERKQFLIATHQKHFLNNCRNHFNKGRVIELTPRNHPQAIVWSPGDRLSKAQELVDRGSYDAAPTELRKYCEGILRTLSAYCITAFFDPHDYKGSLERYTKLPPENPLSGANRGKIVKLLSDTRITTVLNPGSHDLTEPDVTAVMVGDCLAALLGGQRIFEREVKRLDKEYNRSREVTAIPTSIEPFPALSDNTNWKTQTLMCAGSAAAKGEAWVIEDSDDPASTVLGTGGAVLVAADSLDPIARLGQWVLLAPEEEGFNNGDLVAANCSDGDRLLRRIWSHDEKWTLQAVNPVQPIPDFSAAKTDSAVRRIIGVLYEPFQPTASPNSKKVHEWCRHDDFPSDPFKDLAAIAVEGMSLDPIARAGQKVLLNKVAVESLKDLHNGDLAVVDSADSRIGRVIKRVYKHGQTCLLISPNPVAPHQPEILTEEQLNAAKFNLVRGVLFESSSRS